MINTMLTAIAAIALLTGPAVTTDGLLREMTDRTRLTASDWPSYTTHQASSYDRASLTPGNEAWFANADFGKFVREETNQGRQEMVMADLKGPGAVVRIWSANPLGTIRFYFDGETSPRLTANMADLLRGKVAPFELPFAYEAARGCTLYFPFPYAQSLKITVEDPSGNKAKSLYYHVGYRSYIPGPNVAVGSYQPKEDHSQLMAKVSAELTKPHDPAEAFTSNPPFAQLLRPGESREVKHSLETIEMAITNLSLIVEDRSKGTEPWSDPARLTQILRHLIIECEFDGQTTVRVPAADFFGAAPSPVGRSQTFMTSLDYADKKAFMSSRWVMPFGQTAVIRLINRGKSPVVYYLAVEKSPYTWHDGSLLFHAEWRDHGVRSRPFADMTALDFPGQGRFVGLAMHIANRTPTWWGEGDEKIWVDGDAFPSTFGTGTEDYFGYAWCDPTPFAMPYHAQPHAGKPGNFGQTSNVRWHVLDDIPFTKSIKFAIEKWHWEDADTSFATTAFWYARPSSYQVAAIPTERLAPMETIPPKPVEGAIEGETLPIIEVKGGTTERQGGFRALSAGEQLWWKDAAVGSKLRLKITIPRAGRYAVQGHFCFASDYGRHRLSLAGQPLGEHDFYGQGVTWKRLELGTVELPVGETEFVVEVLGSNPLAEPKRHMFGLDYLLLTPVEANEQNALHRQPSDRTIVQN